MEQNVIEIYKASEECHQEKLLFARSAFVEGMDDTQRIILKYHSDLNLDFLDEDLEKEVSTGGVPAPRAGVAETEGVANALLA